MNQFGGGMGDLGRMLIATSFVIIFATSLAAQGDAAQPPIAVQPAAPTTNQSPQDVKGWRGTEWGMTPERVEKVLNQPFEKSAQNPRDKAIWWYTTRDMAVGAWM